jgi:hypothetical protein
MDVRQRHYGLYAGATQRGEANSSSTAQETEIPKPGCGAWCTSIKAEHFSRVLTGDGMKAPYDHLASCVGLYERDRVWLCRPIQTREKPPKVELPWEGIYKIIILFRDPASFHSEDDGAVG